MVEIEKAKGKKFELWNLSKYRNVLMGLQIIMIIFFHFTEDCANYNVKFYGIISGFYQLIKSSGVDMFLLLSGLGLYFSWKRNQNYKDFYRKRFSRILIPYFFVGSVAWIIWDLLLQKKGIMRCVKDLTFVSFFTEGQAWMWYIFMILVCYLIFPYVFRVVDSSEDSITEQMRILLMSVSSIVFVIILKLYNTALYENISIALLRFPVFFVGCMLGKMVYEKRNVSYYTIWGWIGLSLFTNVFLGLWETAILRVYSTTLFNFGLCMLLIMFLGWSDNRNLFVGKYIKQIFGWFGRYSLELYLIHVVIRKIMINQGYMTYRFKYEIVLILLSFLAAIVLKKISEPIIKKVNS